MDTGHRKAIALGEISPTGLTRLGAETMNLGALTANERAQWQEIIRDVPALRSPFLSPAFAECAAKVHSGVRVCVLTRGGQAAGFLPYQFSSRWHGFLGAAERVGGHMSDVLGLIARPGLQVDPGELLRACDLQAFDVSHLPVEQQSYGLTGERPEPALTIDISAGWDDFWAKRRAANAEFVRNTQQKLRKIENALGPLTFEMHRANAPDELTRVIDAKRAQYRHTKVEDAFKEKWTRDLLHGLYATDEPDCRGLLSVLRAGDTWIASHFGLQCGNRLHHWFPVYNPELSKFSPGRLLMVYMLQQAGAAGIASFDMGAGAQDYKQEFATGSYSLLRGQWRRAGVRSLVYRGSQSLAWRLQGLQTP